MAPHQHPESGLNHSCSRRRFLNRAVKVGALGIAAGGPALLLPATLDAAIQDAWRFCRKCNGMFFDGYPDKGMCPAGRGHVAQGYNFKLPYNVAESRTAQGAWRYCGRCHAMFFDGYPQKGSCTAGGGHAAAGYVFVLPHDVRVTGLNQAAWRFCNKCHVMFYDGYPTKGRCAAGGGHQSQGYNFVLRFQGNLEDDVVLIPADD